MTANPLGTASLLLPLALAAAACQSVPYTGRSHVMLVSRAEEIRMGEEAYAETLGKSRLSRDPAKTEMIRRVGARIAAAAGQPDFRWEFHLIEDDRTLNAWCLPGGKVAFYTGILPVAGDEEGIAVVMGHEVAHALARHGSERMSQAMMVNFGGEALNVLLADRPAETRALCAEMYGLGAAVGVMLPYSREHESEADHIGLILMAKAGYDPGAALAFWKRMEAASGGAGAGGGLESFLRTHPTDADRQRRIAEWLPEVRAQYGGR
jgi:predicted Zn-dependent protease